MRSEPKDMFPESWIVDGSDPETIVKVPLSPPTDALTTDSTRNLQLVDAEVDAGIVTDAEPVLGALLRIVVYVLPPFVDKRMLTLPVTLLLVQVSG